MTTEDVAARAARLRQPAAGEETAAAGAGGETTHSQTTRTPMDNTEKKTSPDRQRLQEETSRAAKLIADVKKLKADLQAQRNYLAAENERRQREVDGLVQRARVDAERRYRAEKVALEVALQQKQDELDKAVALKADAEELLIVERQKLEKEREALKAQAEAAAEASAGADAAATQDTDKIAALEAQVAEIRQILDTEFARNAALVELARQERSAGESTRRAISEKAEQLIRDYRGRYDRLRNQEEARLREERRLIEAERESLHQALEEVLKLRDDAEAARRKVEEQAARLRAQQMSEIDAIEAEALAAARRLREQEQSQVATREATQPDDKLNRELLERTYDFQNQLRKQLQTELDDWLSKQNPGTVSPAKILEIQQQNIDRIRRKADEIRDRAQSVKLDFDISGNPDQGPGAASGDSAAG